MSLKVALETLGLGPCYHMSEVFANPQHVELWEAAARGEPVNWEELFRGYRATVDWPGAAFYEELMEKYPDAKVILTVRDPEKWYESARSTIFNIQDVTSSPIFSLSALRTQDEIFEARRPDGWRPYAAERVRRKVRGPSTRDRGVHSME